MTTAKNALVTGANKGIGHEVTRQLAAAGFKVWLGARDAARGMAAARTLRDDGLDVEMLEIDVTDDASIAAAAAAIGPRLDVLVNNAGIAAGYIGGLDPEGRYARPPSREALADIRATYDVNVYGPIRVIQAFLPPLLAAPAARIVMVSSYLASLTRALGPDDPPIVLGYGSSKTALNAVTVAFARELAGHGIKVNAAAPGYTATGLNGYRGGRTAAEAAGIIVRLATLEADGPTGGYFDGNGPVAW